MFNSPFLETLICMVLVFAMLSLLASLLHEIQSQYLEMRSEFLTRALQRMLSDDPGKGDRHSVLTEFAGFLFNGLRLFAFPLAYPLMRRARIKARAVEKRFALVEAFFGHSLIKYMGSSDRKRPSYISKESFATALIDICKAQPEPAMEGAPCAIAFGTVLPESVEGVLQAFYKEACRAPDEMKGQDTLQSARERKFRSQVMDWYAETMDRATGWYKRESTMWLFWWGLLIAIVFNADTVRIFRHFMNDAGARQIVTSQAVGINARSAPELAKLAPGPDPAAVPLDTLRSRVMDLVNTEITGLDTAHLFGWQVHPSIIPDLEPDRPRGGDAGSSANCSVLSPSCTGHFLRMVWRAKWGLLITAVCVSFGAPFWFDLMSSLISMRGSGASTRLTGVKPEEKKG